MLAPHSLSVILLHCWLFLQKYCPPLIGAAYNDRHCSLLMSAVPEQVGVPLRRVS